MNHGGDTHSKWLKSHLIDTFLHHNRAKTAGISFIYEYFIQFLNFREETTLSPLMDLLWSFNEVNKWLHLLRAICDYNVENECGLLNRLVTGMMVKRKKRKDSVYIYTVYHHVL